MPIRIQFNAVLSFLSEKDGGLATPVSSEHRAAIKLSAFSDRFFGTLKFHETDIVFAGDKVSATITLATADIFPQQIYEGLDFEFYEIDKLIGTGVVTKINNANF
ncbi:MAG: hypothetical protein ITG00_01550 [Flavobacterium sp.]|nr:hypothetical protein [Flavobacterium sp.]